MADLFEDDSDDLQNWIDHEEDSDGVFDDAKSLRPAHCAVKQADQESDEDIKLFQDTNNGQDEQYNKTIRDIMGLAKKKVHKQVNMVERRQRRVVKVQEYYFSKAYLVIQVGRCLSIANKNFGFCRNLIITQLLSYLYSVPKVKLGTNEKLRNIKSLLLTFNRAMWNKLDYNKDCEVRADYRVSHCLATQDEDNKLNRIEYLQLFNALLQHHGYKTRFLCAFETKSLEELGFVNVSRTSRMRKNDATRSCSLKQKIMAKRKRTNFDLLKETEREESSPTARKIMKVDTELTNNEEINKIRKEQQVKSTKAINFLDKFAFSSQKSSKPESEFGKSERESIHSHFPKSKRTPERRRAKKKIEESNLFVTKIEEEEPEEDKTNHADIHDASMQKEDPETPKPEELRAFLQSDDEEDSKFDHRNSNGIKYELMKDLCCLEVLNTSTNRWIIVDVFNEALIHSKLTISNWIEQKSILFLFAVGDYKYNKIDGKTVNKMYMRDVTLKYCSYFQQMLAAKNSIYLQDKIIQDIDLIAPYFPNICADPDIKKVMESEDKEIYNLERYYIPEKYNGFRSHKHFVLESLLGKYQFVRPGALPFNNLKHKGDPVYLRKDIVNLHTKEQWRRLKREVRAGTKYIKKIKGNYNDKDKMALLFGYWQTRKFENKLKPDGSLPSNDHGNIEIFYKGDVPTGATHIKIKRSRFICKKLGIDFKEAMTGFENGANRMSYPIIDGVIVLDKDVDSVIQLHDKMEKERLIREEKKRKSEAKNIWRMLIKRICVKRYTAQLFEREPEERAQDLPTSFKKQ